MYDVFLKAISLGNYDLPAMLEKIKVSWVEGEITTEERAELESVARDRANPDQSLPGALDRIKNLELSVKKIEQRLSDLENPGEIETPGEGTKEWPEFVQPIGAHDAYNTGDKITFEGKKYVCLKDNIVWNPTVYPEGWELFEEVQEGE